jgi:hypothetical protein
MEDIAIHQINGVSFIYLGDIGNSDFNRDIFTIYRSYRYSVLFGLAGFLWCVYYDTRYSMRVIVSIFISLL